MESPPRAVVLISSNACIVPHVERLQHKCEVWLIHGCAKESALASAISNPVKCWKLSDVIDVYTMDLTHTTALLRRAQPGQVQQAPEAQPVQVQQAPHPQPVEVQQAPDVQPVLVQQAPEAPQAQFVRACNVCGVAVSKKAMGGHEMLPGHVAAALRCGAPLCEKLHRREVAMNGRKLLVAIQTNKKKQSASEMQVTVFCSVCGTCSDARMSRLDDSIFECHLACFAPKCSTVLPQKNRRRVPAAAGSRNTRAASRMFHLHIRRCHSSSVISSGRAEGVISLVSHS